MKTKLVNLISWIIGVVVLVGLDQYTKLLVVNHLKGNQPYVLWEGVFEFYYSENRGAAFGMLQGKQTFFFVIATVVIVGIAYLMYRMPDWSVSRYHGLRLCLICITAGAIGNMIDRVTQGFVVDFLYFKLIDFPIFNVADIYVTVSTACLVLLISFYYKEEELAIFEWKKKEIKD